MNIKGRNKVDPSFNMSSMTDIVFLLLIFFMLTSTLVTVNAIDVLLPKASGKTENNKSVAVSITDSGAYYVDKKAVASEEVEQILVSKLGTDRKKTLVIRGDKNVQYDKVMKIIDIASRNKFKMILAVKGK